MNGLNGESFEGESLEGDGFEGATRGGGTVGIDTDGPTISQVGSGTGARTRVILDILSLAPCPNPNAPPPRPFSAISGAWIGKEAVRVCACAYPLALAPARRIPDIPAPMRALARSLTLLSTLAAPVCALDGVPARSRSRLNKPEAEPGVARPKSAEGDVPPYERDFPEKRCVRQAEV